jgi:hypothetical protein
MRKIFSIADKYIRSEKCDFIDEEDESISTKLISMSKISSGRTSYKRMCKKFSI